MPSKSASREKSSRTPLLYSALEMSISEAILNFGKTIRRGRSWSSRKWLLKAGMVSWLMTDSMKLRSSSPFSAMKMYMLYFSSEYGSSTTWKNNFESMSLSLIPNEALCWLLAYLEIELQISLNCIFMLKSSVQVFNAPRRLQKIWCHQIKNAIRLGMFAYKSLINYSSIGSAGPSLWFFFNSFHAINGVCIGGNNCATKRHLFLSQQRWQ